MHIEEGMESAVVDFVAGLLRALGCETNQTLVRRRKRMQLAMRGEIVYGTSDVCVMDDNTGFMLLVQEDRNHIAPQDPEAHLVAQAVAAFQENNKIRKDELFLEALDEMIFPGVVMNGTFPRFYKIKVTAALDQCVQRGLEPLTKTIVYRHTPRLPTTPMRRTEGMRSLDNREVILRCFEGLKEFAFHLRGIHSGASQFMIV